MLWLFDRNGTVAQPRAHVGASCLLFVLIPYLILSGITQRGLLPLLASVLVGFLLGGTLLWGVLPPPCSCGPRRDDLSDGNDAGTSASKAVMSFLDLPVAGRQL